MSFVDSFLWTHLLQLYEYIVAHEGHEREGREDGKLVEEGEPDAGGARLLVPLQVLHHNQQEEVDIVFLGTLIFQLLDLGSLYPVHPGPKA